MGVRQQRLVARQLVKVKQLVEAKQLVKAMFMVERLEPKKSVSSLVTTNQLVAALMAVQLELEAIQLGL